MLGANIGSPLPLRLQADLARAPCRNDRARGSSREPPRQKHRVVACRLGSSEGGGRAISPRMRFSCLVVLALCALVSLGCNGEIASRDTGGTGASGGGGTGGFSGSSGQAGHSPDSGVGGESDAGDDVVDAFDEYIDPGCPDAGPAISAFECDPIDSLGTCGAGLACAPFIDDPIEPCAQETYGAVCTIEGTGGQGDECSFGCKAGFTCAATGQGIQCVKMCQVSQPSACSGGLVCEELDIPGLGGCL